MKKVAKEKIEGKAKEERGEVSARENEGLWLREKITRSLAPFPSITFCLQASENF